MWYKYNYVSGQLIGKLIFLNRVDGKPGASPRANFKCECGKEFICVIRDAKNEITKSCGCKKLQYMSLNLTKHAPVEYYSNGIKKLPILNQHDIKRFWEKVSLKAPSNECWEWQSFGDRYGYFKVGKADYKANRMAYFLHYDIDPAELCVMHSCDNGKCCNPAHLSLGTHWDNMQDMARKGRAYNGKIKEVNNNQNNHNEN